MNFATGLVTQGNPDLKPITRRNYDVSLEWYDAADNLVIVVSRQPGLLTALDADTGEVVAQVPCADMTDSMTWDPATRRIYVAGSQGLSVFRQNARDDYTELLRLPTNGGNPALIVPELGQFYVVHPRNALDQAGLLVFRTER